MNGGGGRARLSYKRKLLVSFLLLALVPTLVLIATQKSRLERAIDFWENPGVERSLEASARLAEGMIATGRERAGAVAAALADTLRRAEAAGATKEEGTRRLRRTAEQAGIVLARIERSSGPGARREPVFDYRAPGIADSLRMPEPGERAPAFPPLAAARDSADLPDGARLFFAASVLLPAGISEEIRAVHDGDAFYKRLRVYERYAKTKVAAQAVLVLTAAAVLAFLVADRLSRSLGRPIEALVEATKRIRGGDLDVRIEREAPDEIGALVEAFNEMTRDLRAGRESLARAERVATWAEAARRIAHEIKNPLTPITLSLHRMQKRAEILPPEERRAFEELLQPMIEEVGNLRALADAFSDFARLPAPRFAAVDLPDLLEKVAALYREGTEVSANVRVAPGTPPVRGDRELLWRAFSNLVKNGIEAMEGRGELALSARGIGPRVEVLVSDTGPGVPPELRERIFAPTFTTKRGGSGLGLALVERIVHDHAGTIAVEPHAPRGTTFRVELPASD